MGQRSHCDVVGNSATFEQGHVRSPKHVEERSGPRIFPNQQRRRRPPAPLIQLRSRRPPG